MLLLLLLVPLSPMLMLARNIASRAVNTEQCLLPTAAAAGCCSDAT
jgi:hypothetical protein